MELVPLDITEDTVIEVGCQIFIGVGLGVTDAVSLQQWLIHYEEASAELWQIFAYMTEWLANSCPPWVAYHVVMAVRLIGLDKKPSVRPMGIDETRPQCFSKCILVIASLEAKEACSKDNLCGGLKLGI